MRKNKPVHSVHLSNLASRPRLEVQPRVLTFNLTALLNQTSYIPMIQEIFHDEIPVYRKLCALLDKQFNRKKLEAAAMLEMVAYNDGHARSPSFEAATNYLLVLRAYTQAIIDSYEDPAFEFFRGRPIADYRDANEAVISCTIQVCQQQMQMRYDEVMAVHDSFHRGDQIPVITSKVKSLVDGLYRDIEAAYQLGNKLLQDPLCRERGLTAYHYGFLKCHIEAAISQVRFINKNWKSHVSRILGYYDEIKAIADLVPEKSGPGELLGLRARIALNVERSTVDAMRYAAGVDFELSTLAMNLDGDEDELIEPFNQNLLLKLGAYLKDCESRKLITFTMWISVLNDILSGRQSMFKTSELIQSQFCMLSGRLMTYVVAATQTFLCSSDVDELNDFLGFIELTLEVFEVYGSLLSQYQLMITEGGFEDHRTRLTNVKLLINQKIVKIQTDEQNNIKNYETLRDKIDEYNANFEALLLEFESTSKPKVLAHHRPRQHSLPQPSVSEENRHLEESVDVNPATKSVTQLAREYFDSVKTLEEIEQFIRTVPPENASEAWLCIGDEYMGRWLFGSAITSYELALSSLGLITADNDKILSAIMLSLDFTKAMAKQQMSYAEEYLKRARDERDQFIVNLGLRASMRDNPQAKLNLRDPATREKLHDIGLEIFKKIGQNKRKMHLTPSKKTKKRKNIEERLNVFKQNHQRAGELLHMAKETEARAGIQFPTLSRTRAGLFQPAPSVLGEGCDLAVIPRSQSQ